MANPRSRRRRRVHDPAPRGAQDVLSSFEGAVGEIESRTHCLIAAESLCEKGVGSSEFKDSRPLPEIVTYQLGMAGILCRSIIVERIKDEPRRRYYDECLGQLPPHYAR